MFLFKHANPFQKLNCFKKPDLGNFKGLKLSEIKLFSFENRNFRKSFKNSPSTEKLTPDGNLIYIITRYSYSPGMKLQNMNNIFHMVHFHINWFHPTFKEVHVIKSRGALGTG